MNPLSKDETHLTGKWILENRRVVADETCRRIEHLIAHLLQKRAASPDGWSVLYQDPGDGRFWELTYPQSEMQGGGPPDLRALDPSEVRAKYGVE
jgi:hypothetical protein